MTDVDGIAERLYASALSDFVAERKRASAALRGAGDRSGAAVIGALPKPSTSAWIVNLLVREKSDLVSSLADLGDSLRSAQDDLDPAALRALGDQRRQLVGRVGEEAAALAEDRGQKAGGSIRDEVEQTLQAALADSAAMRAVRTGRLIRALRPAGFDAVDLDGAVAGEGRAPALGGGSSAERPKDDLAEKRRRKEHDTARKAAEEAEAALSAAQRRVQEAESAREDAERHRDELVRERDELRARLEEAEQAVSSAAAAVRATAARAADAQDELEDAEASVERVRSRLGALGD